MGRSPHLILHHSTLHSIPAGYLRSSTLTLSWKEYNLLHHRVHLLLFHRHRPLSHINILFHWITSSLFSHWHLNLSKSAAFLGSVAFMASKIGFQQDRRFMGRFLTALG